MSKETLDHYVELALAGLREDTDGKTLQERYGLPVKSYPTILVFGYTTRKTETIEDLGIRVRYFTDAAHANLIRGHTCVSIVGLAEEEYYEEDLHFQITCAFRTMCFYRVPITNYLLNSPKPISFKIKVM